MTPAITPTTDPRDWPVALYAVDLAVLLRVGVKHVYRMRTKGQLPPPVMDKRCDVRGSMKWGKETVRRFIYGGAK